MIQDLLFIGIAGAFFGATALLVALCDILADDKRRGQQ